MNKTENEKLKAELKELNNKRLQASVLETTVKSEWPELKRTYTFKKGV